MKNIEFNSIRYNIIKEKIEFIYIGKLNVLTKLKYICKVIDKKEKQYAFLPIDETEFIQFLSKTKMDNKGENNFDYTMQEYNSDYDWLATITFDELLELYIQDSDTVNCHNVMNFKKLCNDIRNEIREEYVCNQNSDEMNM